MRLRHMSAWVAEWTTPEMYAGVAGRGAQDAWYSTAVDLEEAFVGGGFVTGGAVDIHKCFDQINRVLVEKTLRLAGMPERILRAYLAFLGSLVIYFALPGSLGQGHARPCGIPQGCPLSMVFRALFMRPWLLRFATFGAHARAPSLMICAY